MHKSIISIDNAVDDLEVALEENAAEDEEETNFYKHKSIPYKIKFSDLPAALLPIVHPTISLKEFSVPV